MSTDTFAAASEVDDVVPAGGAQGGVEEQAMVDDELLVEEISIDGMCGVY